MNQSKHFDNDLESLRGFAAIMVVIHHLANIGLKLDPGYTLPWPPLVDLPGHLAVLVFFVLSGYVIGLTNKTGLQIGGVLPYLKKRLLRLYPIYGLVVLMTFVLLSPPLPLKQILANMTFTQVMFAPVINEDLPLWSLHYEVLYYLLFIPVALSNIRPIYVITISLTVGIAGVILTPQFAFASSLAFGFCLWLAGLALAQYRNHFAEYEKTDNTLLISNMFMLLALGGYNIFNALFRLISTKIYAPGFNYPSYIPQGQEAIPLQNLTYTFYCLWLVANFASFPYKWKRQISLFLQLSPLLYFAYLIISKNPMDNGTFLMPTIWYAFSLFFFFVPDRLVKTFSQAFIKKTAYLGSISFGIYIVHHPIIEVLKRVTFISGSLFTYLVRVVILITCSIAVAYWLEKKYQPFVRNFFIKK